MKPTLNLRQSQRLAMTPQLQQAIKLLQMNTAELGEELVQAHETNPLLEMEEAAESPEVRHEEEITEVECSDASRESMDEDWVSSRTYDRINRGNDSRGDGFDMPDGAAPATLKQSLEDQLALRTLPPIEHLAVEIIIQYISDAGYLEVELDEILNELVDEVESRAQRGSESSNGDGALLQPGVEPDLELVKHALGVVQGFEPTGTGARSPHECLGLQLSAMHSTSPGLGVAKRIVSGCLELLGNRDYQGIRRKLKISESELKQSVDLIKHLNPHPGYSVGDVSFNYIVPDVVVEFRQGGWLARLNTASLPNVVINKNYQQLVTENSGNESFARMKEQLQDARWLLANIEKRHSTILAVASQIVERQQAFFEHGPATMKPMILRDVADALDIHESTVSRATNGKYMLTPLGIYELRYFFSAEMNTDSGDQTSSVAIQTIIRQMIEQEPPRKPISDMKICDALNQRGFQLARRTVAKYREQMNIPPSSKRKSL